MRDAVDARRDEVGSVAGGELGPGAGRPPCSAAAATQRSSSWRRATTCRPTGIPSTRPAGMLNAGLAGHVERRGERGRQDHQVDLLAVDRPLEHRPRPRTRSSAVVGVSSRSTSARTPRPTRAAARGGGGSPGRGARPRRFGSPSTEMRRSRSRSSSWSFAVVVVPGREVRRRSSSPHARPGFGNSIVEVDELEPGLGDQLLGAASSVSASTPVSHRRSRASTTTRRACRAGGRAPRRVTS